MKTTYIEVPSDGNYIIIKQNLDEGFLGFIVILTILFTIAYIFIKNTTN